MTKESVKRGFDTVKTLKNLNEALDGVRQTATVSRVTLSNKDGINLNGNMYLSNKIKDVLYVYYNDQIDLLKDL